MLNCTTRRDNFKEAFFFVRIISLEHRDKQEAIPFSPFPRGVSLGAFVSGRGIQRSGESYRFRLLMRNEIFVMSRCDSGRFAIKQKEERFFWDFQQSSVFYSHGGRNDWLRLRGRQCKKEIESCLAGSSPLTLNFSLCLIWNIIFA